MLALTLWSCSQLENAQREAQVTLMTTMMIAVACAAAAVWFVACVFVFVAVPLFLITFHPPGCADDVNAQVARLWVLRQCSNGTCTITFGAKFNRCKS
jgi:type II secretory pathway component PulF